MSKRVLITGGCGGLGYILSEYLVNNGYKVSLYDIVPKFEFEFASPKSSVINAIDKFIDANEVNIKKAISDCGAKTVIHAADQTNPDAMLFSQTLQTNVNFTASLARICAVHGIRLIIPMWKDALNFPDIVKEYNIRFPGWAYSQQWKAKVAKLYNIGSAVINLIYIPRIIGPYFNCQVFGNFVNRVYRTSRGEGAMVINELEPFESEYISYKDPLLFQMFECCIERKTRENKFISGCALDHKVVIQYVMKSLDMSQIQPLGDRDEFQIIEQSPKYPKSKYLTEAIDVTIEKLNAEQRKRELTESSSRRKEDTW